MSNSTKIWLIIAASLVVLGLVMFSISMSMNHWDFKKLSSVEYETNVYELNDEFNHILINTNTADILFVTSENQNCKVVCYEEKNMKHSVAVKDGVLTINSLNQKNWYEYIGVNFDNPKITVYLPEGQYNSIVIKEDTGDINIPKDFKFENMDISSSTGYVKNFASAEFIKIHTSTGAIDIEAVTSKNIDLAVSTGKVTVKNIDCDGDFKVDVSTGKVEITDVRCKNLISEGNTGDITLENVVASEKFYVKRSTGDVKFDSCDAFEIFVETSTGDVTGDFLTEKSFDLTTDTGKIDVPKNTNGGKCEIITDTGDIKIK